MAVDFIREDQSLFRPPRMIGESARTPNRVREDADFDGGGRSFHASQNSRFHKSTQPFQPFPLLYSYYIMPTITNKSHFSQIKREKSKDRYMKINNPLVRDLT